MVENENIIETVEEENVAHSGRYPLGSEENNTFEEVEGSEERNPEDARFYRFLKTLYGMCSISGFYIHGRLKVTDTKTGKTYE